MLANQVIDYLQPFADRQGLSVYEVPVRQINGTATVFSMIEAPVR